MNRNKLFDKKFHNLSVKLSGCYLIMDHVACSALCIVARQQAGEPSNRVLIPSLGKRFFSPSKC